MNRRSLLRAIVLAPVAAAAAPLAPILHRSASSPSIRGLAEGVARFSEGRLRFVPYQDPMRQGPWLGWVEDAKGVVNACVDVTRRVWWQTERALPNGAREVFLERGSVIP